MSPLLVHLFAACAGCATPGPGGLDLRPVTNAEFAAFVRRHPRWRRSQVPGIFAEQGYLAGWDGDVAPAAARAGEPVTDVSWFAAEAYCEAQGGQLPGTDEWERVYGRGTLAGTPPPAPMWEWTLDFDATQIDPSGADAARFGCGGAAAGENAPRDDAAFMRAAMRASLKGAYTLHTLGFRCKKDQP